MTADRLEPEAPPMPAPEELERRAAATVPTVEGCWWVTAQASLHLLSAPARRDPQSGDILPQPLGDVMEGIGRVLETAGRPLPADPIQLAAESLAEPLRHILHRSRSKILRNHVLQPLHQLREMDAACINWLGRLPGRNVREKLAGRTSALGVIRAFSLDTHENRVVRRVARMLGEWVGWRLEAIAGGVYDEAPQIRETLALCHELCVEDLGRSPLAEVPLSLNPEPNNVLLRDRDYYRVWRAWLRLKRLPEDMEALWEECEARFRTAFFWALVARVSQVPGSKLGDCLSRVMPGSSGVDFGIEAFEVGDGRGMWSPLPSVTFALEPMLPSRHHRLGTITKLSGNARGLFGFLQADDGGSYFLHPKALADPVAWDDLQVGVRVAFTPATPRACGRPMREITPPAENVRFPTEASLLTLTMIEGGIETTLVPVRGDRLLYPATDEARVCRYGLRLDRNRLRPRRGVGLSLEVTEYEAGSKRLAAIADLGGVRTLLDGTVASFAPGPPLYPPGRPSARARERITVSRVGLDLAGIQPVASLDGESTDLPSMLFAVRYPLDAEGTAEWVVARQDRWTEILRAQWPFAVFGDLFNPSADSAQAGEAAERIFERIRNDLNAVGTTSNLHCAFAVPDSVDEWSQYVLRSAANKAVRGALPIWRSVSAALGWQATADSAAEELRSGDVVIVLDATGNGLSATFLIARHDAGLQRILPETKGIYWERRACLTSAALPEDLGELAMSLTCESLHREYLAACLAIADNAGGVAAEWQEFFDRLIRAGVVEGMVRAARPVWLPLGSSSVPAVLHIPLNAALWTQTARDWAERLRAFLGELTRNELFRELLQSTLGEDRTAFLLTGSPFHLQDVRNALVTSSLPPALRRFRLLLRGDADRLIASGAGHFLVRLERNLPSWRDWLPELYLEVIRDGHFHEMQLMDEHLLETEATNGTLGQGLTTEVEERLLLPAGSHQYAFPLQVGRRRDRLPFDAFLSDPAFPLSAPLEVRLELTYRYGLENAYDLAVIPVGTSAPFKRLEVTWSRRAEPRSEVPAFPWRRPYSLERVEECRTWFLTKAKDFARKCEIFFGRPDGNRQLKQFAQAMVSRWNESLAHDQSWPEVSTDGQGLTVFAEWIRKGLEFPMRVIWDAGNGSVTDEEVTDTVRTCLRPWLMPLSGLESEFSLPTWYGDHVDTGLEDIRGISLGILARLQKDAPNNLLSALAGSLSTSTLGGHATRDAIVFAIQDGKGPRKECLRTLLEEIRQVLTHSPREPDREKSLLWVLSRALWRHQHFVFTLADEHRWFLPWLIDAVESSYRADLSSLVADPASDAASAVRWRFGLFAEILLGLLRLRKDEYYAKRILATGNARMLRIARFVRRIDAALAARGVTVKSSLRLRLSGEKRERLFRMSELAFALNEFLTGDAEGNLVQIASLEDDEGVEG